MNKPNKLALIRERFLVWLFFRSRFERFFMTKFKYYELEDWLNSLSDNEFMLIINFEYESKFKNPTYEDPNYRKLIMLCPGCLSKFVIDFGLNEGLKEAKNFLIHKIWKSAKYQKIIKDSSFTKFYIESKIEKFLNFIYE